MNVLALDTSTSTTVAGLCAVEGGSARVLSSLSIPPPKKAGELLPGLLERACVEAKLTLADVHAVVVGIGPGSFTGLRVGLAAAKGIAYARKLPLVGVSSLRALARTAFALDANLSALVAAQEARRGEVFLAAYARGPADARSSSPVSGTHDLTELLAPAVRLAPAVPQHLHAYATSPLVGAGAVSNRTALLAAGIPEANLSHALATQVLSPDALSLVQEALPQLSHAQFDLTNLFAIAPDYLSESQPELALAEGRVGRLTPGS